jgi:hypothetical protein
VYFVPAVMGGADSISELNRSPIDDDEDAAVAQLGDNERDPKIAAAVDLKPNSRLLIEEEVGRAMLRHCD